jgi:hypothetical protein
MLFEDEVSDQRKDFPLILRQLLDHCVKPLPSLKRHFLVVARIGSVVDDVHRSISAPIPPVPCWLGREDGRPDVPAL